MPFVARRKRELVKGFADYRIDGIALRRVGGYQLVPVLKGGKDLILRNTEAKRVRDDRRHEPRRYHDGAEVVSDILKLEAKAAFIAADLGQQDAPARIISAAIDKFGRLDGLVNAAGLSDRVESVGSGTRSCHDRTLHSHIGICQVRLNW